MVLGAQRNESGQILRITNIEQFQSGLYNL